MIKRWIYEEDGQTLVEYGLLIALLALVAVTAMSVMGKRLLSYYGNANTQLPND